jgi:hypothetical protein
LTRHKCLLPRFPTLGKAFRKQPSAVNGFITAVLVPLLLTVI